MIRSIHFARERERERERDEMCADVNFVFAILVTLVSLLYLF